MRTISHKIYLFSNFLLFMVFIIIFCPACTKDKSHEIKLGVVAPYTGTIAIYGENIKNGILLAVDEINNAGGINGVPITAIFEDEAGGPQSSVNAVNKLITIDHVQVIIGPATTSGVLASAPIAEKNHVILFSPSGTSDNIREAGDYIFRNRASASQEAEVFSNYIIDELGIKKFTILRADADYAKSFADVCKRSIAKKEGAVFVEDIFSEGSTDFRSQLAKIKAYAPEGLIIIGVPIELGNLLKQIKEIGIKAQLFSNTIDSPKIFEFAGETANGLTFVTTAYDPEHSEKKAKEFHSKYMQKYGKSSHLFGANAYDAVHILKAVIEGEGYNGERIKQGLYRIKGFVGAAGIQEFDDKGDLKYTNVAVKKITDGEFRLIKEIQR